MKPDPIITKLRVTTWEMRRNGLHIYVDGQQVALIRFDTLPALLLSIAAGLKNRPET